MSTPWRLLNPTLSDIQLPALLISTVFTSNSYRVNITDLTYMWSESLDRRSIIKRSLDEDTSIDPSEDAEQLRVFLDKVQSGLSGAAKTNLSLQAISTVGSKDLPNLDIYITVELPKGLKPLQWPIHLTPLPQTELSTRLTLPILRAQNARMKELDRLVEILKEKDHVIRKLVDKLEETGTELGHVFPGVAGKGGRKIPRKIADERVKGLGVFEVKDWKKEMRLVESKNENEDIKLVVRAVYEEESPLWLDPISLSGGAGTSLHWWNAAEENPVELSNSTREQIDKTGRIVGPDVQEHNLKTAEENEDDFQIQATPPHLDAGTANDSKAASSPPTLRSQVVIQDSTDDDDDLDAPSQRSVVPDSVPLIMPKQQAKKFGTIGRPKATTADVTDPAPIKASDTTSPIPQTKPNGKHLILDDEETASEDEGDPAPAKSPTPPPPPLPKSISPAPPKSKKAGLGKIGGKARRVTPPPITRVPKREDSTPALQEKPHDKPKPKLGVIGHRPTPAPAPTEPEEADRKRGRSVGLASSPSRAEQQQRREEPRENSIERADRKREELKRMLEEKAKAPARKKRKF